jgi:hypothetical protein
VSVKIAFIVARAIGFPVGVASLGGRLPID